MITNASHIKVSTKKFQADFGLGQRTVHSIAIVAGEGQFVVQDSETSNFQGVLDAAKSLSKLTDMEVELPSGEFTFWEVM
jgi:hypothetical protein